MMRILFLRTSSIGDVVLTLPAFNALRQSFPGAYIAWMVDRESREILDGCEGLDEVLVNPLPNGRHFRLGRDLKKAPSLLRQTRSFLRRLRARRFDVALELQGLFRTGFWCRASGASVRVGLLDNVREMNYAFVTHRVAPLGRHTVERMAAPAAFLGADVSRLQFNYRVPRSGRDFAQQCLNEPPHTSHPSTSLRTGRSPVVAINPGASWEINRWPAEKLAAAANRIRHELGARILLIGGVADVDAAEAIARRLDCPPLFATGRTTLTQLMGLLERCNALVTADTGPMHMAAAVGTPVVAIFGPSDPRVSGPYSDRAVVVETSLPCRPCWRRPIACEGRIDCLHALTPDDVAGACVALVERYPMTQKESLCHLSASPLSN